jgi:hypothetical protein
LIRRGFFTTPICQNSTIPFSVELERFIFEPLLKSFLGLANQCVPKKYSWA